MGGSQSLQHTDTYSDGFPVDMYEYKWTVPNIQKLLSCGVGYSTSTSVQTLITKGEVEKFKMVLYPNGFNERVKGYVSVWLQKLSSKERLVTFNCAIVDDDGRQILKRSTKRNLGIESSLGWINFCPRNMLVEDDFSILKDGNLTLVLTVQIFNEMALSNPEIESEDSTNTVLLDLSNNLMSLFLSKAYYDFTIHVQDQKFPAHKAILSARSPVLRVMLQSQLSNSISMEITDISDNIVKLMLDFMYSGKVGNLDFQEASELYYAADTYEIDCLKNICCNILMKHIKVENVINALILSERHSDVELREICIKFVVKNASQVQELDEWMEFLKMQPVLANIIFRRLASKSNLFILPNRKRNIWVFF